MSPPSPDTRRTLAWAHFANGHMDEAAREMKQALELAPDTEKFQFEEDLERLLSALDEE